MSMGKQRYIGTSLRIANDITFMPATDPKRHHAIVTAICNRGTTPDGKELRDEITLNFWGKMAQIASFYLYKGKQVNVEGRLQSYAEDKGVVNAAGKRVLDRKVEVVVEDMQLLGDSMKEIEEIVATNIQLLKNAGRLPQNFTITAAELLKSNKPKLVDFNPELAAQTGKYGRAKVWTKDRGFWIGTGQAPQTNTQPAPPANNTAIDSMAAQIQALKAELEAAKANVMNAGANTVTETADPFPVA